MTGFGTPKMTDFGSNMGPYRARPWSGIYSGCPANWPIPVQNLLRTGQIRGIPWIWPLDPIFEGSGPIWLCTGLIRSTPRPYTA